MEWVTSDAILAQAGLVTPTAEDTAWSELCADATNGAFDHALRGAATDGTEAELLAQALRSGTERFKSREAPYGITGVADLTGAAIRLARDPLESDWPALRRYMTKGLG